MIQNRARRQQQERRAGEQGGEDRNRDAGNVFIVSFQDRLGNKEYSFSKEFKWEPKYLLRRKRGKEQETLSKNEYIK